jgi:hypothetical protein
MCEVKLSDCGSGIGKLYLIFEPRRTEMLSYL